MLSSYASTALLAFAAAMLVAIAIAVPYVIIHWRRTGTFGWGSTLILFGSIVYAFALGGYTMLPLPDFADRCQIPIENRWIPFGSVQDVQDAIAGVGNATPRQAVAQLLLNVALFVPLGMFVRQLVTKRVLPTVLIGFAVSALIEVTQLTAAFGLFPCQWRIFDVDDLLTNTTGALTGALLAPLLKFVPGQPSTHPSERLRPRDHTRMRTVAAVLIDLLVLSAIPVMVSFVVTGLGQAMTGTVMRGSAVADATYFVTAVLIVLLNLVVMIARGTTIGEWTTWTAVVRAHDGAVPGVGRRIARFATSILIAGVWVIGGDVSDSLTNSVVHGSVVAMVISLTVSAIALLSIPYAVAWVIVLLTSGRTLTDVFAGTRQVDARASRVGSDHRSLESA